MGEAVRKAKRFNYIAFAIVFVFVMAFVGVMIREMTKPLCDSVTLENLESQIAEFNDGILVKTTDGYYEISASENLAAVFAFDGWENTSQITKGNICIALRFAELYVLEIYDTGYAAAYDGYASRKTVPYAYYRMSEDIIDPLTDYIEANGTVREMGDGKISQATFLH